MRSSLRCIVLDFDGTFTDVEREAEPYVAAYRADLAARYGQVVERRWDELWGRIAEQPECGWKIDGRVVAPALADPYIRSTVTADALLSQEGLEPDPVRRRELLSSLYRTHYRKADVVFRPDARPTLERLLASGTPIFVVSNSETDAVRAKLGQLGAVGGDRLVVFGGARKYLVAESGRADERFERLPTEVRVAGLERPLLPRRGHYHEVLSRVWEAAGAGPESTFVCGDIYELDLLLPGALGARVHLLARPTTPAFERRAVRALHGGSVGERLGSLLDALPER